jgi:hypothetical protein
MPARLVWFRATLSLPFPFLAAAIAMAIGKSWTPAASIDAGYVII